LAIDGDSVVAEMLHRPMRRLNSKVQASRQATVSHEDKNM
jgi:hypothetical protein